MEFLELTKDRYLVKGTQSRIVNKEEMLKLQRRELVLKDITSNGCQKENTIMIEAIDKELEEVADEHNIVEETEKPTPRYNKSKRK